MLLITQMVEAIWKDERLTCINKWNDDCEESSSPNHDLVTLQIHTGVTTWGRPAAQRDAQT